MTEEEIQRLQKENDILRGIAAKIMPCHYCGVDEIIKCPHGFPGCALADDLMVADECANHEYRRLKAELAKTVRSAAYLVLVTWPPDEKGEVTEGILFPRPGNVKVADTLEMGMADFEIAKEHLREYVERTEDAPTLQNRAKNATIRLIQFERGATLQEFKL